ncbi:16729_t:CDS:2, partial [Dentiscutata heterogama]
NKSRRDIVKKETNNRGVKSQVAKAAMSKGRKWKRQQPAERVFTSSAVSNKENSNPKVEGPTSKPKKKQLTVDNRALTRCWTLSTPDKLNLIWDIIAGAIRRAADKNIPKKKVSSSSNNRMRKCKPTKLHKSIVKLGKIIQRVKKTVTGGDQSIDIEMLNKEIEQINNMHQADIPGLSCKVYEKETLY